MERFSVESYMGGYHVYKVRTPLVLTYLNERYWPCFLVMLLPCSLLCLLPPSHVGQFDKGDHTDQEHCQQGASSEKKVHIVLQARLSHYLSVRVWPARLQCGWNNSWVERFVGGKFCDTGVKHENTKN